MEKAKTNLEAKSAGLSTYKLLEGVRAKVLDHPLINGGLQGDLHVLLGSLVEVGEMQADFPEPVVWICCDLKLKQNKLFFWFFMVFYCCTVLFICILLVSIIYKFL